MAAVKQGYQRFASSPHRERKLRKAPSVFAREIVGRARICEKLFDIEIHPVDWHCMKRSVLLRTKTLISSTSIKGA